MKGIYTAVSGAMAQSDKMDTIANNIANVDTPAFKRDEQVFREYLTSYEKQEEAVGSTKIPNSIDSFYPLNGADKSYVDSAGTSTSFAQGSLVVTNNPLDIAIEGDAFFEVMTPNGTRWTRNGGFTMNQNGELVTKQGYPVLMQEQTPNQPLQSRFVRIGTEPNFSVSHQGHIKIGEQFAGRLSMVTAQDKDVFQKEGNSFYRLRETINSPVQAATQFKLHQGSIEKSNVNLVSEMTDLIKTSRVFETTQKAIQAYDQMNGKLVNDVTKLR
jgi:flagellar basal-body rod protein FlgG